MTNKEKYGSDNLYVVYSKGNPTFGCMYYKADKDQESDNDYLVDVIYFKKAVGNMNDLFEEVEVWLNKEWTENPLNCHLTL